LGRWLTALLGFALFAACGFAAVWIQDAMGWEGRGTGRTLWLGLTLVVVALLLGLDSAVLRLRNGPRPPAGPPRHAANVEADPSANGRLYTKAKDRLFRGSLR
jgi:hypothetical protein